MISTKDDESESESISIGTCLECADYSPGKVGVVGGGDARKAGLFGIGRKLRNGFTTLAGRATDVVWAGSSTSSSPLGVVFRSEVVISRRVLVWGGGDRGPASNFLNVKYQGHDLWNSSTSSAWSCTSTRYP